LANIFQFGKATVPKIEVGLLFGYFMLNTYVFTNFEKNQKHNITNWSLCSSHSKTLEEDTFCRFNRPFPRMLSLFHNYLKLLKLNFPAKKKLFLRPPTFGKQVSIKKFGAKVKKAKRTRMLLCHQPWKLFFLKCKIMYYVRYTHF
jgi:hypothetical protein